MPTHLPTLFAKKYADVFNIKKKKKSKYDPDPRKPNKDSRNKLYPKVSSILRNRIFLVYMLNKISFAIVADWQASPWNRFLRGHRQVIGLFNIFLII